MALLKVFGKKFARLIIIPVLLHCCIVGLIIPSTSLAQKQGDWQLAKMPADLETELALTALPPHLRAQATVYLLDLAKGYYATRQGSNGFVCFISRTEWEWAEFRNDLAAPMAYDPEGAKTIFPVYKEVAEMRASGKFTPLQIKDTIINRIRNGFYKAPSKAGISYMLAPIMRVYTGKPGDKTVMTMNMPHYMFYAPYITDADAGTTDLSGPALINSGNTVLGDGKGPHGYFIMAANADESAKILEAGKGLLKRLADYSPYFKVDAAAMHH